MAADTRPKGPWIHRFLIDLFTVVLTVLIYWLLGFVLDDIGNLTGPDYAKLESELLNPQVRNEERNLQQQLTEAAQRVTNKVAQQQLLRDSTENSQRTMTQLLELQKLGLQKDVKPSAEEQQALAESEQLFLTNQRRYQLLNEELVVLNAERQQRQDQQEQLLRRIEKLREPIQREYERRVRRHELKIAALKLAFLLPLLFVAGWFFLRLRERPYVRLVYAFGTAVLIHVGLVMHEYFPTAYFKYVVILAALAVVLRILLYLLRMIVRPKREWLLQQFREAYEVFLCPVCSYPIRRGPLRYLFWTRRSIKKLVLPASGGGEAEEPYTCPSCATQLYEPCAKCNAIRLSLLPACPHCGNVKPLEPSPTDGTS